MIKTDVIGHCGMDAVIQQVNGKQVINFSLAHSESYKDAQGVKHDKTIWVRVSYWSDRTGIVPYLKKGTQLFVSGQPDVGVYQDKQGKWQAEFKLRANSIQLLGGNQNNQQGSQGNYAQRVGHGQQAATGQIEHNNAGDITEPMDDLPF